MIKRHLLNSLLIAAAAIAAPAMLTSCSDDDNPKYSKLDLNIEKAGLQYNDMGVWTGWDKAEDLTIGDFVLTHGWEGYAFGFTAAKSSDNAYYPDAAIDHQFDVIPGGGAAGKGSPYIVGNWDVYQETTGAGNTCELRIKGEPNIYARSFFPQSIKVTNTTYAYYTMLHGNAYAKKFEQGDWFKLTISARTVDGGTRSVEFYLANCQGADESKWIVKDWTEIDLTPLGEVLNLTFRVASSDTGAYGMNTPAYFAIDDLKTIIDNEQ